MLFFVICALALPVAVPLDLHRQLSSQVYRHFVAGPATPASELLDFFVALPLPQDRVAALRADLDEIADPSSSRYGQWKPLTSVADDTTADAAVASRVHAWLAAGNASCIRGHASLRCRAAAAHVESLFSTRLTEFTHRASGRRLHRVHPGDGFAIPPHVEPLVPFVTHLYDFPTHRRHGVRVDASSPPGQGRRLAADLDVALESVRALYGVGSSLASSAASGVGPVEFSNYAAVYQ